MTPKDLGYYKALDKYRSENGIEAFAVGRVVAEHKERYIVKTIEKEYDAEILGNLRYSAQSRADFPAVGDWVAISEYDDDKALIHAVLPRKSILERQAVGAKGEKQIIATNIDVALIVQALDRDFNINRIERYLTICNASKVDPVIVLNKTDLIDDAELTLIMESIQRRIEDIPIFPVSNETQDGIGKIKEFIKRGKTYCLLGSSGVGKSSLLNSISGQQLMKTESISKFTNKGRHITTHRELRIMENGGILIDNPGMREVGITDTSGGLEVTFERITALSDDCRFKDCTHTVEDGCAVIDALQNGELDESSYENYLRLGREKEHYEATVAEKRKKQKDFGKMVKQFKKIKKTK